MGRSTQAGDTEDAMAARVAFAGCPPGRFLPPLAARGPGGRHFFLLLRGIAGPAKPAGLCANAHQIAPLRLGRRSRQK